MSDITRPTPTSDASPPAARRETVLFYRSCAHFSPIGRCWHLQVRGSIFAPSSGRIRNQALLHLFKRVVKPERERATRQRFLTRANLFLQDTKKGKSVPIAIAERAYELPKSQPNGYFETVITVQESDLEPAIETDASGRRFVQFCGHLPEDERHLFAGEIELIPPEGISVISDVDDTIKITDVANRKELLANTFTREFRAVDGMRALYQRWSAAGVSYHYVSASPWPLYEPLVNWLHGDGFPMGTMHLRHVRLRDWRRDRTKSQSYNAKRTAIENLLRMYPYRKFVLCGDSGERDAELYGEIARDFGPQVLHVAIRHYPHGGHRGAPQALDQIAGHLKALDRSQWTLFQDPAELEAIVPV